jgi:hypothetical protein
MQRIRTLTAIALASAALLAATPARAGGPVDLDDLVPSPPPGADCELDGNWVICHTAVVHDPVDEPILELPCGTVYETAIDARRGIRWYDAGSGVLQKRFVAQDLDGMWSLSPTGGGVTVAITAHAIYWNVGPFEDPEDPDSWPVAQHGVGITLQARGVGVILQSPVPDIDDPAHGLAELVQLPAVASELCEVLQG